MRRVIPLWISIPWWVAAMAICIYSEATGFWPGMAYTPIVAWALSADRMRIPEKPFPRWK